MLARQAWGGTEALLTSARCSACERRHAFSCRAPCVLRCRARLSPRPSRASTRLDSLASPPLPCRVSTVQLDAAEGTSPFSVRYYHRDKMRKHTAYYPDTPLSLNHNIMQGHPLRPDAFEQPANLPVVGHFGNKTYGTHAHMNVRPVPQE